MSNSECSIVRPVARMVFHDGLFFPSIRSYCNNDICFVCYSPPTFSVYIPWEFRLRRNHTYTQYRVLYFTTTLRLPLSTRVICPYLCTTMPQWNKPDPCCLFEHVYKYLVTMCVHAMGISHWRHNLPDPCCLDECGVGTKTRQQWLLRVQQASWNKPGIYRSIVQMP
jgi:hypothetical protein